MSEPCGNRLPISGECVIGCGGFGGCRQGKEDNIRPRPDIYNPLTGELYPKWKNIDPTKFPFNEADT